MPYRLEIDDDLIIGGPVDEPPWEEGCVRMFARRFTSGTRGNFSHLGTAVVELLFWHEYGKNAECISTKVTAAEYQHVHSLRMAQLVNSAIAGGGQEIGIVGFGYFADERE